MASLNDFKIGDKVSFLPSPRTNLRVTAEVTGKDPANGGYLITKDATGKERRTRPGSAKKA